MKQIDKYVKSIYRNVSGENPKEIEELRHEMRTHLIEAVEELKAKGIQEKEAIQIAIENFGGKNLIQQELTEFYTVQRKFSKYVLAFALLFLTMSLSFLFNSIIKLNEFNNEVSTLQIVDQEKKSIMDDVFDILDSTNKISESEQEQLLGVFEKYQEQLNFLAVFPSADLADWLKENEIVLDQPVNRYPINYEKAGIAIGDNGVIENKNHIIPSEYDLGTVVMANEQWTVQYEYNRSYENTVESFHQLQHYGPSKLDFFQVPILFFSLFLVLAAVCLFLNRQNRKLKSVFQ